MRIVLPAVLVLLLAACGKERPLPPFPAIDTASFHAEAKHAIEQAASEAKARSRDSSKTLQLAKVLHAYGQYRAAAAAYARAYALDPTRYETLYCWGQALAADGAYDAAAERLRQSLVRRPESIPASLKLAEVIRNSGDTARSAAICRKVLDRDPGNPVAHFCLGRALEGAPAIQEYQRALARFPRYGAAQFALASSYRREGKEKQAQEALRNYARDKTLDPPLDDPEMRSVRALNTSSTGLLQQAAEQESDGHLEEAAALSRGAIASDPKLVDAWVDLISLYARLRQDTEAGEAYRQAVSLDASRVDAYYNYGVFCLERGRIDDARAALEHAIRLDPRHPEALHNLGVILEHGGKWDSAAALYRRSVEARPAYPLAHFHLGRIYANQRKYGLAIAEFEQSLEPADAPDATYLYALAATHARAGHRAKADELMRKARTLAVNQGKTDLVAGIDRDIAQLGMRQ